MNTLTQKQEARYIAIEKTTIACRLCKTQRNLQMLPLLEDNDQITTGFFYICRDCLPKVIEEGEG